MYCDSGDENRYTQQRQAYGGGNISFYKHQAEQYYEYMVE